jgi:hypothetical protein
MLLVDGWMGGWPVCEVWADRWVQGEGKGGGCGFSSLVKQNKKAKICFVIHIAGEKK